MNDAQKLIDLITSHFNLVEVKPGFFKPAEEVKEESK